MGEYEGVIEISQGPYKVTMTSLTISAKHSRGGRVQASVPLMLTYSGSAHEWMDQPVFQGGGSGMPLGRKGQATTKEVSMNSPFPHDVISGRPLFCPIFGSVLEPNRTNYLKDLHPN